MTLMPVWFLAHPVAGDERFTYDNNMGGIWNDDISAGKGIGDNHYYPGHVVKLLTLCFRAGFPAIAPYHTLCLALDDNSENDRTAGMLVGTTLVKGLGRLILSGHKLSRGMEQEVAACLSVGGSYLNLIGVPDRNFVEALKRAKPVRHLEAMK